MAVSKKSMIAPRKDGLLRGRKLEFFHHEALPEWNTPGQKDSFALLHPVRKKSKNPLYVVLHSAGHDLYSCVGCTVFKGNHDIYHAPEECFGLYLDCRAHEKTDFWWGGINAKNEGDPRRKNHLQSVEKRVYATIEWVKENYKIDPERIYLCGNSMGGSGALGLGMCRGDLFAAVKVNVPAGVEHMIDRCLYTEESTRAADPPICINYSAQNDLWSQGHEKFFKFMREQKFPLYACWADFGHCNNDDVMLAKNDLIHSLDLLSIRKDRAYPVFTGGSSDDPNPWEEKNLQSTSSGQINAFFRWENICDRKDSFRIKIFLCSAQTLKTTFPIPEEATVHVTLRRLQKFLIAPGEEILWTFGKAKGRAKADEKGLLTLEKLPISAEKKLLCLSRI